MSTEHPGPASSRAEISEEASRNTLALNPLVAIQGQDLLDSAGILFKAVINEPKVATEQWLSFVGELGSITAGKYADFTILDRDIMTVAPERILGAHVVATYVGGTPVYEAKVTAARAGSADAAPAADSSQANENAGAQPLQREEEWTRGLVARDTKMFERLLAPGFVYTEDGAVMSRDDVIASAACEDTTTWAANEGMKAHDFGDTQIITGVLHVKGKNKGGPFERRYQFTDTWQKRGGTWQLIGAQDYVIPK